MPAAGPPMCKSSAKISFASTASIGLLSYVHASKSHRRCTSTAKSSQQSSQKSHLSSCMTSTISNGECAGFILSKATRLYSYTLWPVLSSETAMATS
ncbi:hypothetical protein D6C83_08405 [Aureobasidium pullulans]|uniref:Uncharacterized protein n=1 Tax=Aureobasidium pullulans TaxID=5580 RepID=A0A4V4L8N4_AURPU|nr:hypothetical protein D6C83_08405 [Aureobasidium pullulans]